MPEATTPKIGRPPGRGVVATMRRQLGEGRVTALVEKLYEQAIAGDLAAAKLILDRVVPVLRTQAQAVTFDLPEGSLTEQARALLRAAANGHLPPDIASEFIGAIGKVVAVEQLDEVKRRLDALEFGEPAQ